MLDRRWRKGVEQGLGPIGDRLRRLGITADALTVFGLACSVATAVLIASGHFVWAVVGADRRRRQRPARRLDRPRAAARRARAAPSSTRSPTASPTRCCFGGVAWYLAGRSSVPADPRVRGRRVLDADLLRAGPGRVARPRRPRRAHGAGRAVRAARRRARRSTILVPMLWLMLVLTALHRGAAVRARLPPGRRVRPQPAAGAAPRCRTAADAAAFVVDGAPRRRSASKVSARVPVPAPNGAAPGRTRVRGAECEDS